MIRFFIFILIRFFVIALVIYFVLTILKKIIQALQRHSQPASRTPQPEKQQQPKEEYKDVKDANFIELPNTPIEEKKDSSL